MVGISRPVVKHSFLVKQTEDIPQVLKKAFWLAASGRPGPVVVDLPKDILNPANRTPLCLAGVGQYAFLQSHYYRT